MKKFAILALGALAAACGPQGPSKDEVAQQAALERIMGRVDCMQAGEAGPPAELFGAGECRLNPKGGEAATDRHILVDFAPVADAEAEAPGVVTATLVTAGGEPLQTMAEKGVDQYLYPAMEDFDGDGALDLLITRNLGNANSAQAVWRFDPKAEQYVRLGEILGVGYERTAAGEIAVIGRSSAVSYGVDFLRVTGNAMEKSANVEVSAKGEKDGKAFGVTCKLSEWPEGADTATKKALEAKYCAEPVVRGMFE